MTLIVALSLFMLLAAVAIPAIHGGGKCGAIALCVVLMGLLATTGGVEIGMPFLPASNFGNILYAAITFAVGYYGTQFAPCRSGEMSLLVPVAAAMVIRQFVFIALAAIPVTVENAAVRESLAAITSIDNKLAVASLIAFYIAQAVNLRLVRKWAGTWGVPLALMGAAAVTQAADSLIFFPIAFPGTAWGYMLGGYAVKVGMAVIGVILLSPWLCDSGETEANHTPP